MDNTYFLSSNSIVHASFLLLNSDRTISEISEQLGYTNPVAFYTAFKKIYGVTPYEYKKQIEDSTRDF